MSSFRLLTYSKSVAVFSGFVRRWWSGPVDYVAQVEYFGKRAMAGAIKTLIGLGTGMNGILSLVLLLPFAETVVSEVVVVLFGLLQIGWGWAWCGRPWPSRRTSLAFVVSADIGIATMALVDGGWLLGLFGFNAFAMISVYLMFFDGPKLLAGHALWILGVTAGFAMHAGATAGIGAVAFTASTLAAVTPVVATPLGIQLGIWAMRNDANESVTDPLTGLLNRRGLYLHVHDLLREAMPGVTEIAVVVIDLDRFKDVNDKYGHTVGDEVLIRSARRVKSAVRGSALVARVGGEEFVVVDFADWDGMEKVDFAGIVDAIAAPADPAVTASVGITSIGLDSLTASEVDLVEVLDASIARADRAMFVAKRNGGNATIHVERCSEGS